MANKKALDYINEVKSQIQRTESSLTEAHSLAEKDDNKQIIENAMSMLVNTTKCLSEYKD